MRRAFRILAAVIALIGFGWLAHAQVPMTGAGRGAPAAAGCSQATAFLARSTLTGSDATNYTTFICAGVTHGWWAKMDAVYVFAAPDSTNALLNLVQNVFSPVTLNGAPGFVAHSGFIGVDASSTVFIDTGFNPATATTPNFVQDSAHISACSLTNAAAGVSGGISVGLEDSAGNSGTRLFPKYSDGNFYGDINSPGYDPGIANADSTGQYVVNRSGATALQKYRNGSSIGSTAEISAVPKNGNVYVLASDRVGSGPAFGGAYRIAIVTLGGNLSSTDVSNLHSDSNTLMTAFGTGGC